MTPGREEFEALRAIRRIEHESPRYYGTVSGTRQPAPSVMQRLRKARLVEHGRLGERPDLDSPVIQGGFASRMEVVYGPKLTEKGRERFSWYAADDARWQTPGEYAQSHGVSMAKAMQIVLAADPAVASR